MVDIGDCLICGHKREDHFSIMAYETAGKCRTCPICQMVRIDFSDKP